MNTQKVAKEYRLSQWAQVIQERRNSGQSVKDFCERSGISKNTYFYWQRKLREAACAQLSVEDNPKMVAPSGWMQLSAEPEQSIKEALDIEVSGCRITVTKETDLELLKKVCLSLRMP
jgi:putative transposase